MAFRDRTEAGRFLAQKLFAYASRPDLLVLALPRGGVPVAFEVARALSAPLDVLVVRKLGVPGREEFAMGAIAPNQVRVLDSEVVRALRIPNDEVEAVEALQRVELERREREYRGDRPPARMRDRTLILVDDGLATGSTMRAAVMFAQEQGPARVVVAVPVGSPDTCRELGRLADEVVCAVMPDRLVAVGSWYEDFSQTTDEEVRELLERAAREHEGGGLSRSNAGT